jgi:putative ABC transport system ATP-binding protein
MMAVVSCRSITRRYERRGLKPVTAVEDVDLEVADGTFVAIEGPSGSGKTTLLGLLAGLESPDAGSITVLGHDLARLSSAERARLRQRRIGIVFQSFGLIASLRAGENVTLPSAAFARSPSSTRSASGLPSTPGSTSCPGANGSAWGSPGPW